MSSGLRILIASPLGEVIAAPLRATFDDVEVVVAPDKEAFERGIAARVRFDVVAADLVFNRPDLEWTFDGLDVIEGLHRSRRLAPVLLATQGHSMEEDHLAEARLRPDVSGVVAKADGLAVLMESMRKVAVGQTLRDPGPAGSRPALFELFTGRRGVTAARLAGAIAAGNASDNASLARVAKVSAYTANKVAINYLGPMMRARHEHDDRLPLTQAS
ncbi:MAG: response regulator, partial [Gordonia sp. (in: high G+C Gram-positive bacteria)]